MYPVTQATPPQAPSPAANSTAITMFGNTASAARKAPAPTSAAPNIRRRLNPASSRGPNHIPPASPVNTAANSTPKPGWPAPRSVT